MSDTAANVLSDRYAGEVMNKIWSPEGKIIQERRLWLAVLRAQVSLGLEIDAGTVEAYEAVLEDVDLGSVAAREAVTRHDVKARIDEFCELAGRQHIHRGMTSRDLTENVEQLQIRQALALVRDRLVALLSRVVTLAETHIDLVMVARTHNVAAQATTLGKRFADVAEETMIGLERVEELLDRYPLRGVKGAVGTRLDQLDLLKSTESVDQLEQLIAEHLGFGRVLDSVGQVYPRSLDLDVVSALVQAVSAPASAATTLRLMAGNELATEGFSAGQVGSSAMPHKMNSRSAERIGALRTILDGHLTMAASLAGRQWNEGDVSCSAVRRVMLPDAFFAADGLLQTAIGVFDGFGVFAAVVEAELQRELPFLATSRILGDAVAAGLGREEAHQLIKGHAVEAVLARREGTTGPGLVERLAADERIPLNAAAINKSLADIDAFAGTAATQVQRVVARASRVISEHPQAAVASAEIRV
ncbi:MAG: adenylosuccinate lyase [Acidimicrobiaceae bacterium]|nr:adenylosuccinate lyase [Acidimicrobiaceae bacterium]MDE0605701.1 adenylosuccinate lyase [Acidimicrobiaceae bacterium]